MQRATGQHSGGAHGSARLRAQSPLRELNMKGKAWTPLSLLRRDMELLRTNATKMLGARARGLDGQNVTSAIAHEGVILAGTTTGVFRSDDSGEQWHAASDGLHTRHVRWMAFHPGLSDYEFVGTEPAAIFVSHNGG